MATYIHELVSALPDDRIDRMVRDLAVYEATGIVTGRAEKILRRAACLADADRILNNMKIA